MNFAIDAGNIRSGGGLTHLTELLSHAEPEKYGIKEVVIWSSDSTLTKLPDKKWLIKKSHSWLNKSFLFSFLFQIIYLPQMLKKEKINLLFVPGGTFLGDFETVVTMSQNMLPFEIQERQRFTKWSTRLRFRILEKTQAYTFRNAKGVIFLTQYAKEYIQKTVNLHSNITIIPHGINLNFLREPREQKPIDEFSEEKPFKLLYVSVITAYKHQWNVAEAVLKLRKEGFPVVLELVGGYTEESFRKLSSILAKDKYNCISYIGNVDHKKLASVYRNSDGFVFASTCENQPIILLEAMASGLPIVCSNKLPMPDILGNAGYYFDSLDIASICTTLKNFLLDTKGRQKKADLAYSTSVKYTWKQCSDSTFEYLSHFME
jgi:glycosyltransferase involved in cell wall biosynthesis